MGSKIQDTSLTVTIKEVLTLSDTVDSRDLGGTNTLTITNINEASKRIVTVPTSETTLVTFGTTVAAGQYIKGDVRYIRLTNKDDTNYIILNIEGDASTDFSVRLDPYSSYLIISQSATGVVDYADISGKDLEDLTAIKATADNDACDIEIFIANA